MAIAKNRFKNLTLSLFITLSASTFTLAEMNYDSELFVASGFPYEELVQRYDQVLIRYTENNATDEVLCRAEFNLKGKITQTQQVVAKRDRFIKTPMKACLDRSTAKQILAATFE